MVQNYTVWVEKKAYPVVVSDERKALLAAKAAGRAFVGLIHLEEYGGGSQKEERTEKSQTSELLRTENQPVEKAAEGKTANDIWDAEYLATPDAICPEYLERIVRRHIGLPWIITETDRLLIREFTMEDIAGMPEEPDVWFTQEEREADQVFYDAEKLKAYIKGQYRFYEYGIWALVRKTDGRIIGKAGLSNAKEREAVRADVPDEELKLGYHVFHPYRRQGYAEEACRAILDYAKNELDCPVCALSLIHILLMVAVMVMQYLGFRGHANAGDVIVDGVLTWDGGIYLLIFAFFALIIVNLLLKAWVDKRGGSAE